MDNSLIHKIIVYLDTLWTVIGLVYDNCLHGWLGWLDDRKVLHSLPYKWISRHYYFMVKLIIQNNKMN